MKLNVDVNLLHQLYLDVQFLLSGVNHVKKLGPNQLLVLRKLLIGNQNESYNSLCWLWD
jgi:beta-galactosidase beta subunit